MSWTPEETGSCKQTSEGWGNLTVDFASVKKGEGELKMTPKVGTSDGAVSISSRDEILPKAQRWGLVKNNPHPQASSESSDTGGSSNIVVGGGGSCIGHKILASVSDCFARFASESAVNKNGKTSLVTGPASVANMPVSEQWVQEIKTKIKNNAASVYSLASAEVGILHFAYPEAPQSELVWCGYGDKSAGNMKINKKAYDSFKRMMAHAEKDGVKLVVGSIFRSIAHQRTIKKNNYATKGKVNYYRAHSEPGYSEHHTGMAIDFRPIDDTFNGKPQHHWLVANAHKYGFVQTFTETYRKYSGVKEEAWHWKYVGENMEYLCVFMHSFKQPVAKDSKGKVIGASDLLVGYDANNPKIKK